MPTVCYTTRMAVKRLTDAMKLVETWPKEAQEELAGIDRGLLAADERRFVEPGDVAAVFAKHRPA